MSEEVEPIGTKGRCLCSEDDPSFAFQLYSDGHGYCHAGSCTKKFWSAKEVLAAGIDLDIPLEQMHGGSTHHSRKEASSVDLQELIARGEPRNLPKWKVSQDTARKWDYRTYVNDKNEGIHLAVYRDESGTPVAAKVRNSGKDGTGKDFHWEPAGVKAPLYGIHLLPPAGKKVVVCEGEKDTLSASQLLTHVPVVGIPNGAGGQSKKDMAPWVERLSRFDEVVLAFDPDEAGNKAMQECARLFAPGKVSLAKFPSGLDITELVQAGRAAEVTNVLFHPEPFRPDGIVSLGALENEMLSPTLTGRPYPLACLTEWTYGRRDGEVIVLAAGTGVGKSDLMIQIAAHNVEAKEKGGVFQPCAVFNYEAGPQITGKAVLGKLFERRFHIPDPEEALWTPAELREALAYYKDKCAQAFINDHQGATDWDSVKERIRYLKHAENISDAYVDPMAALVATLEDERKGLDKMMAEAKMLAEELKIGLWFNTHVTRPSEGPSHEEGGRVTLKHLRGSNAIGMWASYVFALERNQQGDEEERAVTTLRCLKDRFTGNATGRTQKLRYNILTGMLEVESSPLDDDDYEPNPEAPPL